MSNIGYKIYTNSDILHPLYKISYILYKISDMMHNK